MCHSPREDVFLYLQSDSRDDLLTESVLRWSKEQKRDLLFVELHSEKKESYS